MGAGAGLGRPCDIKSHSCVGSGGVGKGAKLQPLGMERILKAMVLGGPTWGKREVEDVGPVLEHRPGSGGGTTQREESDPHAMPGLLFCLIIIF